MNKQQLVDKYGAYKLVCYFVDVTHQFEDGHSDVPPLKEVAGKIYECRVTTLKSLINYTRLYRGCGVDAMSAGYVMTNPYPIDDDRDENDYGSYRWAEDELRDMWYRDENNMYRDVDIVQRFFILDKHWQPTLDTWRYSVYEELQREYMYVGYMKPSRKGNWYAGLDRDERKDSIVRKLIEMSVSHGDFTSDGSIPDGFSYDSDAGWEPFDKGVVEMVNVNYSNYREDDWMEVE